MSREFTFSCQEGGSPDVSEVHLQETKMTGRPIALNGKVLAPVIGVLPPIERCYRLEIPGNLCGFA